MPTVSTPQYGRDPVRVGLAVAIGLVSVAIVIVAAFDVLLLVNTRPGGSGGTAGRDLPSVSLGSQGITAVGVDVMATSTSTSQPQTATVTVEYRQGGQVLGTDTVTVTVAPGETNLVMSELTDVPSWFDPAAPYESAVVSVT